MGQTEKVSLEMLKHYDEMCFSSFFHSFNILIDECTCFVVFLDLSGFKMLFYVRHSLFILAYWIRVFEIYRDRKSYLSHVI